jgi:hypothetical protein
VGYAAHSRHECSGRGGYTTPPVVPGRKKGAKEIWLERPKFATDPRMEKTDSTQYACVHTRAHQSFREGKKGQKEIWFERPKFATNPRMKKTDSTQSNKKVDDHHSHKISFVCKQFALDEPNE